MRQPPPAIGNQTTLDRKRAAEEGAEIADRLLTMCIRAIDYCPPTDLQFRDLASAILTADWELNPRDEQYKIRVSLLKSFRAYGIEPSSPGSKGRQEGSWDPPPAHTRFHSDRTHFDSMKADPQELFLSVAEPCRVQTQRGGAYARALGSPPGAHRARWLRASRNRR